MSSVENAGNQFKPKSSWNFKCFPSLATAWGTRKVCVCEMIGRSIEQQCDWQLRAHLTLALLNTVGGITT